jgi:hypothetical protein
MTPEGKIKELVKKFLKSRSIPYWMIVPSGYGANTGFADFVAILPSGWWLAIETKAAGKKKNVTANQQKFLDTINANNGIAVVVDCQEDIDKLAERLDSLGL